MGDAIGMSPHQTCAFILQTSVHYVEFISDIEPSTPQSPLLVSFNLHNFPPIVIKCPLQKQSDGNGRRASSLGGSFFDFANTGKSSTFDLKVADLQSVLQTRDSLCVLLLRGTAQYPKITSASLLGSGLVDLSHVGPSSECSPSTPPPSPHSVPPSVSRFQSPPLPYGCWGVTSRHVVLKTVTGRVLASAHVTFSLTCCSSLLKAWRSPPPPLKLKGGESAWCSAFVMRVHVGNVVMAEGFVAGGGEGGGGRPFLAFQLAGFPPLYLNVAEECDDTLIVNEGKVVAFDLPPSNVVAILKSTKNSLLLLEPQSKAMQAKAPLTKNSPLLRCVGNVDLATICSPIPAYDVDDSHPLLLGSWGAHIQVLPLLNPHGKICAYAQLSVSLFCGGESTTSGDPNPDESISRPTSSIPPPAPASLPPPPAPVVEPPPPKPKPASDPKQREWDDSPAHSPRRDASRSRMSKEKADALAAIHENAGKYVESKKARSAAPRGIMVNTASGRSENVRPTSGERVMKSQTFSPAGIAKLAGNVITATGAGGPFMRIKSPLLGTPAPTIAARSGTGGMSMEASFVDVVADNQSAGDASPTVGFSRSPDRGATDFGHDGPFQRFASPLQGMPAPQVGRSGAGILPHPFARPGERGRADAQLLPVTRMSLENLDGVDARAKTRACVTMTLGATAEDVFNDGVDESSGCKRKWELDFARDILDAIGASEGPEADDIVTVVRIRDITGGGAYSRKTKGGEVQKRPSARNIAVDFYVAGEGAHDGKSGYDNPKSSLSLLRELKMQLMNPDSQLMVGVVTRSAFTLVGEVEKFVPERQVGPDAFGFVAGNDKVEVIDPSSQFKRTGTFDFGRVADMTLVIPGISMPSSLPKAMQSKMAPHSERRNVARSTGIVDVPEAIASITTNLPIKTAPGCVVGVFGERDVPPPLFYYPGATGEEIHAVKDKVRERKEKEREIEAGRKDRIEEEKIAWEADRTARKQKEAAAKSKAAAEAATEAAKLKGPSAGNKWASKPGVSFGGGASSSSHGGASVAASLGAVSPPTSVLASILSEVQKGAVNDPNAPNSSVLARLFVELIAIQRAALVRQSNPNHSVLGGLTPSQGAPTVPLKVNVPPPPPPVLPVDMEHDLRSWFENNGGLAGVPIERLASKLFSLEMFSDYEGGEEGIFDMLSSTTNGARTISWNSFLFFISEGAGGSLTSRSFIATHDDSRDDRPSVGFPKDEEGEEGYGEDPLDQSENSGSLVNLGTMNLATTGGGLGSDFDGDDE